MNIRRTLTRTLAGLALAAGLGTAAVPAAGAATVAPAAPVTAGAISGEGPPPGYVYSGSFYWHSSCTEAGDAGMNRGWTNYACIGSASPFDDYELWVLPK